VAHQHVGSIASVNYGVGWGWGTVTPVHAPVSRVGVTVIMLRAGDPTVENAFDAQQVLRKYAQ
jgi:hypothetical protein